MKLPSLNTHLTIGHSTESEIELGEIRSPSIPTGAHLVIHNQGSPILLGECDILSAIVPLDANNMGTNWIAVGSPSEKFTTGMNLYGVYRVNRVANGGLRGQVNRVVRYERRHIVYGVRIGSGTMEYTLRAKYRHAKVGLWRRLWIFVSVWKDACWDRVENGDRLVENRGVRAWAEYVWGAGFYLGD